jgi:ribonuclease VapC
MQKARLARRDFGQGSGRHARPNFDDRFSYDLAEDTGEPLLFQGQGFTHTDVVAAAGP